MNQKGSVLILSMVVMIIILFLAGIFLQLTLTNLMLLERSLGIDKAYWIAFAGINQARHDLKEYYFQNQMSFSEKDFGEGKFKVGIATLIGQGIHRSIIVSTAEYPLTAKEDERHKKSMYCIVGMNTATDYIYFVDSPAYDFRSTGAGVRTVLFAGPVHVNGDCTVGENHEWDDGSQTNLRYASQYMIKSNEDYGPVLSASGTIFHASLTGNPSPDHGWCVFGEGDYSAPYTFNYNNVPSNFSAANYAVKNGEHIWPGYKTWQQVNFPEPFYDEGFKDVNKAHHIGLDGEEFSYDLVQHKNNGGSIIKVPKTQDINYNTFKQRIDPEFHITSFSWGNPCAKKVYIPDITRNYNNPQRYYLGSSLTQLENLNFSTEPYAFFKSNSPITPQFVKYVFLKNSEMSWNSESPMYVDCYRGEGGSSVKAEGNKVVFTYDKGSVSPGQELNGGTGYGNIRDSYRNAKGISWEGHFFSGNPVGGKWLGRRIGYKLRDFLNKPGGPPPSVSDYYKVNINYDFWAVQGIAHEVTLSNPIVYPDSGAHAEKIIVSDILYERAAGGLINGEPSQDTLTTIFSNAGSTQNSGRVYVLDYYNGDIYFGASSLGNVKPSPNSEVATIWTHPFSTPVEVWVHEPVPALFIDLDKIDENNCPRDPEYPDDKDKFGVIYSTVPLFIMGKPSVPVTIVSEGSVYLGPVNSSRLEWDLNIEKPTADYLEDSDELCPVGIITKSVLTFEHTFSVKVGNGTIDNNVYIKGSEGYNVDKLLKLNKVAIFSPFIYDHANPPTAQGSRDYFTSLGTALATGTIIRGLDTVPPGGNLTGGSSAYNDTITIIGSVYRCHDEQIISTTQGTGIMPNITFRSSTLGRRAIYSNSFRYWKKDKSFTSGPPPHMPIEMNVESISGGNIKAAKDFYEELNEVLEKNLEYSTELAQTITKLVSIVEK